MELDKLYLRPEIATIRMSIFYGHVEEILFPENVEVNGVIGVHVTGCEIDFLANGSTKISAIKGYLLPISVYHENDDILKTGSKIRTLITRQIGGTTEKASSTLEFSKIETEL